VLSGEEPTKEYNKRGRDEDVVFDMW